ncbi:MAG: hypothetical protein WAL91_12300, partial [Propionicimonas sp.]
GGLVVRAVHRRAGVEHLLGEARPQAVAGEPVRLGVRVRGHEYTLTVGAAASEVVVGVADGRLLDSAATGGFLGLWLGVYGTSDPNPSTTVVSIDRFEYRPLG